MKASRSIGAAMGTGVLAAFLTAGATGDVIVTERLSRMTWNISAGVGAEVDQQVLEAEETDLAAAFVQNPFYDAFACFDNGGIIGCAAAMGDAQMDDTLTYKDGEIVEVISNVVATGEAEHLSGNSGAGTASITHTFEMHFEIVDGPITITLEGEMLPNGETANVRLFGDPSPIFRFQSVQGDSGEFFFEATLPPGSYSIDANIILFAQALAGFDTFDSATVSNMLKVTFGPCIADINGDGGVGPADLAALLDAWGPNPESPADLNHDGDVGPADLALLLDTWGLCG